MTGGISPMVRSRATVCNGSLQSEPSVKRSQSSQIPTTMQLIVPIAPPPLGTILSEAKFPA